MTVSSTTRKQSFAGGQSDLEFSFKAFPNYPQEIKVLVEKDGEETELEYETDYEVTINADGEGGTVVVNPTFSTEYTQVVYRVTTDKQESDYDDYNQFPADTIEDDFDRRVMVSQEQQESIDRSVKVKISSPLSKVELPNPEARKVFGWNDAGTAIENKLELNPDDVAAAEAAKDAAELAQAAAEEARDAAKDAWEIASQAEAEAGTNNTKVMTPLRVFQGVKSLNSNVNPTNLLTNGDFELWSAGTSAAPDGWVKGAGGTIERELTIVKIGTYSAKATYVTSAAVLYPSNFSSSPFGRAKEQWVGRTITFGCWVYATTGSSTCVQIRFRASGVDDVKTYHTGDSTWQWLTATATVPADLEYLRPTCRIEGAGDVSYFDGAMCVEGESAFAFSTKPMPIEYLDTDGTLTSNSDVRVPSVKSVKTYVDTEISAIPAPEENFLKYTSGTTYTLGAANTERSSTSTSYVKIKEIQVAHGGVVRVDFEMNEASNLAPVYGRIYINGVAIGTERSMQSSTFTNYNENFTVLPGDKVQLYVKVTAGRTVRVKNFKVRNTYPETTQVLTD